MCCMVSQSHMECVLYLCGIAHRPVCLCLYFYPGDDNCTFGHGISAPGNPSGSFGPDDVYLQFYGSVLYSDYPQEKTGRGKYRNRSKGSGRRGGNSSCVRYM